ncbi:TD and POZ domain-containing protein 3-like [Oppia nitens]|uniref:TD and POZ domain-containing protein 3-like n=1 Tax=Oppia nitens TaxID=1686743 RepID=UPI0023DAA046|nr:TD and POZ domain-containing protein 3-like [Oppia nitens]
MTTTKTTISDMDNSITNKCKVLFKVDNFADQLKNKWKYMKVFKSEIFTIGYDKWQINIECLNEDIGLYLNLVQTYESSVSVEYDMYIVDNNNQIYDKQNINHTFEKIEGMGFEYIIDKQQLMDNKDRLLPNNAITVAVEITVHKKNDCNRSFKCNHLFGVRELSDCRLIVGKENKEFFVSKFVLSSQSEVFQKMFTTDCLEKTTNEVVIDDIDSDVFEIFLQYLYTGECDQLDKWYKKLLIVANKYLVASLKTICLNRYYMKINGENAIETLKLFEDFGADKDLMAKIHDFIAKNVGLVLGKLIVKHYDIKSESVSQIGVKVDKLFNNIDKK